jgi:hypothetical protein
VEKWLSPAKSAPAFDAPDCPVVHRTVSGGTGAQAGSAVKSLFSGIGGGDVAKIHQTDR